MEHKKLIEVIAGFTVEGVVEPKALVWEDGRSFSIDQISGVRKCASIKSGGRGVRYTCRIRDRWLYLFREDDTWFWERAQEQ
ncbi:MAG: hypothetical protein LBC41_00155 [Clostridiales bacterium]|jgi:hypothetical protein|nr:hypothetical protein [Clostridiales bacterium]MDR2749044.1 hypothetical protein [Clostridiales bacterium]